MDENTQKLLTALANSNALLVARVETIEAWQGRQKKLIDALFSGVSALSPVAKACLIDFLTKVAANETDAVLRSEFVARAKSLQATP